MPDFHLATARQEAAPQLQTSKSCLGLLDGKRVLHCCLHMNGIGMTLAGEACIQRQVRACTLCSVVKTAPLGAKASKLSVRIGIATMLKACNTFTRCQRNSPAKC